MKTLLVLSSALLAVIASAGYAAAAPSDPASAAPAPAEVDRPAESAATPVVPTAEAGSSAVEAIPVSICAEAAGLSFEPLPMPATTCGCLRAPCIIGTNCCGNLPDPYCGKKLRGHNKYAGTCDVVGCIGVCCQN